MNSVLETLTKAGVSIWLDDLTRTRITSGNLKELVATHSVRGVTTNPSIFEGAIAGSADAYASQIVDLAQVGADAEHAVRVMTSDDVRSACDVFADVFAQSGGTDGRVSIEVDPRLARNTDATIAEAQELWNLVDRKNVLIKIPATSEGLPAITEVIGRGISVNVTLIFSVDRYVEVMDAYLSGLELAGTRGHDMSSIESVASFFISRVDSAVDSLLADRGGERVTALMGQAAIANARLAWGAYIDVLSSERWKALPNARPQRPLWASTGVKDPTYSDTRYVIDLVAPGCVNTMPEKTLFAVADHGEFLGDTVSGTISASESIWRELSELGIDPTSVCNDLESDGVAKFEQAWMSLLDTVAKALARA
ncbi:transaldolase [Actinomycetota bacterium]|nr:transaldolase [Actinomycetota bacterium]